METTTLYLKYRPQAFAEVLGQEHIAQTLARQIESDKFAHAFLFSGTRGTGKTSVARIFAREIGTEERDVYEIDAASNRGIDDIREIRESIQVLPFSSPYKVYIIDEVHMLTKPAFDALLKSLEEPPAHVVFILATTELHKIPDTVISRCEVYHFRTPSQRLLREYVVTVGKKEGVEVDPDAAELVAMLGEGAFRDTVGMLQKVLNASGEKKQITAEMVSNITGTPRTHAVNECLEAIFQEDLKGSLSGIAQIQEKNSDLQIFTRLVLAKMRAVLLLRFAPDMKKTLGEDFAPDDFALLEKFAKDPAMKIDSKILESVLGALEQMKDSQVPALPLELALIRSFGQNTEDTKEA